MQLGKLLLERVPYSVFAIISKFCNKKAYKDSAKDVAGTQHVMFAFDPHQDSRCITYDTEKTIQQKVSDRNKIFSPSFFFVWASYDTAIYMIVTSFGSR